MIDVPTLVGAIATVLFIGLALGFCLGMEFRSAKVIVVQKEPNNDSFNAGWRAARAARPWERTRVCVAAEIASNKFQQWVPQRWLELFMDAYEAAEPPVLPCQVPTVIK